MTVKWYGKKVFIVRKKTAIPHVSKQICGDKRPGRKRKRRIARLKALDMTYPNEYKLTKRERIWCGMYAIKSALEDDKDPQNMVYFV